MPAFPKIRSISPAEAFDEGDNASCRRGKNKGAVPRTELTDPAPIRVARAIPNAPHRRHRPFSQK